ncbi:MAG: pseudaminic acid synthase [Gammaproteobacteria bacterium]|nr:MAG: pseudaminic acid synthase [Gammaproteobacteria bacterium]
MDNQLVSDDSPAYIVAEFSGNHGQDFSVVEKMVEAAAACGVDAIKLQTYTADTITLDSQSEEFQIAENSSLWRGETLYSLYKKAYTPWSWHKKVFELARARGLTAFSSPFDESSVAFLESLDVPCYKIASFELNHFPLLRAVAKTQKPVILSTGMATLEEIGAAVDYLAKYGCRQLALLKCTSCYPAPVSAANLKTMADMKRRFGVPVGLSDHSKGMGVALLAVGLGARIVERHFVLDRHSDAIDGAFSSTPDEMALLVKESKDLNRAIGQVSYGPSEAEKDSLKYRRSIYVSQPLKPGMTITKDNIRVVRPGFGLSPKHYDAVLGRELKVAKQANTPLLESDLV